MSFPVVPNVPGVPPLLRAPGATFAAIELMTFDLVAGLLGIFGPPQWGIFLAGFPVVVADNVLTFDTKREHNVPDYQIEEGGFASYDKVQMPRDCRLRFSMGGSEADRAEFIASVDAIDGSLELFDVVTPERIYTGMNVTHQDYRRAARNGVGLLVIDIWLTEIRIRSATAFSNTKQPNVAATSSTGTVQAQPTPSPYSEKFLEND